MDACRGTLIRCRRSSRSLMPASSVCGFTSWPHHPSRSGVAISRSTSSCSSCFTAPLAHAICVCCTTGHMSAFGLLLCNCGDGAGCSIRIMWSLSRISSGHGRYDRDPHVACSVHCGTDLPLILVVPVTSIPLKSFPRPSVSFSR